MPTASPLSIIRFSREMCVSKKTYHESSDTRFYLITEELNEVAAQKKKRIRNWSKKSTVGQNVRNDFQYAHRSNVFSVYEIYKSRVLIHLLQKVSIIYECISIYIRCTPGDTLSRVCV